VMRDGLIEHAPQIKILPHNGVWVIEGDTIISDQVEREGRLDFDTLIPYIIELIRPGDTVVDVGAFIGDHTVAYSHAVGKAGKVLAYEPNPLAFQCLVHNTEKCGNVYTFCHALGAKREVVDMTDLPNAASNYIGEGGRKVHVRPLDEDASLFGQIDLVKIDVEGYELNVLKGMEALIEKFHPQMVIEINEIALSRQNTTPEQIFKWLGDHGYTSEILHRHKDAPFYDILAVANPPPEMPQDAIAHTPASSPVAPRSVSEVVKDLVGQLKEIAETFPQGKSIVSARLVLSGLRPPNKKRKRMNPTPSNHRNNESVSMPLKNTRPDGQWDYQPVKSRGLKLVRKVPVPGRDVRP
jgi:FkbM family methyltransferase